MSEITQEQYEAMVLQNTNDQTEINKKREAITAFCAEADKINANVRLTHNIVRAMEQQVNQRKELCRLYVAKKAAEEKAEHAKKVLADAQRKSEEAAAAAAKLADKPEPGNG